MTSLHSYDATSSRHRREGEAALRLARARGRDVDGIRLTSLRFGEDMVFIPPGEGGAGTTSSHSERGGDGGAFYVPSTEALACLGGALSLKDALWLLGAGGMWDGAIAPSTTGCLWVHAVNDAGATCSMLAELLRRRVREDALSSLPVHFDDVGILRAVALVRAAEEAGYCACRFTVGGAPELIRFYSEGDAFGELSNFAAFPITVDGVRWPTSEHYFQGQKFLDQRSQLRIRGAKTPMIAARLGRERGGGLRRDWEAVKDEVMYIAVRAKFRQHDHLRKLLLATGQAKLVEHTENDAYWGDGGDGRGKNMLGRILMRVRAELATGG